MGRIVCFSEFDGYLEDLKKRGRIEGAILDTNVIITLSYPAKKFHNSVSDFISNKITKEKINLYSTINTKQEYLEFHRRLLMTEGLRTIVRPESHVNLPPEKRQLIEKQLGSLEKSVQKEKREDFLYDREIKKIRDAFCSMGKVGWKSWKNLCRIYLRKQLQSEHRALENLKINYLSKHRDNGKEFFRQNPSWENAIEICSNMGIGFSDSMILNALQSSIFPFAITLDSDMAFAVSGNPELKDIVIPDDIVIPIPKNNFL